MDVLDTAVLCYPGEYVLMSDTVIFPFSCHATDSIVFVGNYGFSVMGIDFLEWTGWLSATEQPADELGVNIYPNPCNGLFTVSCPHINNEKPEMRIFDLFGNEIHSQMLITETEILNLDLPCGIYYIQIRFFNIIKTQKLEIIK